MLDLGGIEGTLGFTLNEKESFEGFSAEEGFDLTSGFFFF